MLTETRMNRVSVYKLKQLKGAEGLVVRGCDGDLNDWINGINNELIEEGILHSGGVFNDVLVFKHDGLTNILFPLYNVTPQTLDLGKLAIWRIKNRERIGGMWLSDYKDSYLRR